MTPLQETLELLKQYGYKKKRSGGSHDIYYNPETGITIPIKRHGFNEDTRRYVLKEAGIKRK